MRWGVFKQKLISLRIIYFVHVLLDYNLFDSYDFGNIKFTMPTALSAVDRNLSKKCVCMCCVCVVCVYVLCVCCVCVWRCGWVGVGVEVVL